ncbi:hypothetical protein ES708_34424 [subsurface metagenome]
MIFFFGSVNGLIIFDPNDLFYNTTPPKVVISGLKLFNREIDVFQEGTVLEKHISLTDIIRLNYKQNMVSFEFTAINMINPEKNQYAYKMEGFDQDWHYVGTKREATYTNLDPGRYTFQVIASNNDGIWNNTGQSIDVHILPPWWMTWWFKIFSALAAVGIVVSFFLFRRQIAFNHCA